jgi:hypothetical protein
MGIVGWNKRVAIPPSAERVPKACRDQGLRESLCTWLRWLVSPWKEYDDDKYMSEQDWNVFA